MISAHGADKDEFSREMAIRTQLSQSVFSTNSGFESIALCSRIRLKELRRQEAIQQASECPGSWRLSCEFAASHRRVQ